MTDANAPQILTPQGWYDYLLLDSGRGRKLEQVGPYRFIRPEMQAIWSPALDDAEWQQADGEFVSSAAGKDQGDSDSGKWRLSPNLPESWPVRYDGLTFHAMPTPFRHLGFFPEQSAHWQWCAERIIAFKDAHGRPPKILNLFGYTGVASLHAAINGAEVTHVDSSKKAVAQAFANRDLAGLSDAPIRFITEDARSFVKREARRENYYDGVILDPPKYGRGVKGEVWRMEEDIAPLLEDISAILSGHASFVVLTSYAIRSSFLSLHGVVDQVFSRHGGMVHSGELAAEETSARGYRIGQAIFARWAAT
ncbi:MAG: class I SAM-dependent methyltransferase [Alphaproteobacteria bacterium]|nr:class I SAM-dependent methyltransferase [Alphaproteobacteria bacterium]